MSDPRPWCLLVVAALVVGFTTVPQPSLAGEPTASPHWYVGAGWGVTDFDEGGVRDTFENQSGLTALSFSLDDDNAWRVLGGYQFTKTLGLELNYLDFNEFDFNGQAGVTTFRGRMEVDGFSLSGVGRKYSSSRFFGLAKVGILRWDSSLRARTSIPSTPGSTRIMDPIHPGVWGWGITSLPEWTRGPSGTDTRSKDVT